MRSRLGLDVGLDVGLGMSLVMGVGFSDGNRRGSFFDALDPPFNSAQVKPPNGRSLGRKVTLAERVIPRSPIEAHERFDRFLRDHRK